MANKAPRISEAELQLLQLLWDESPLGANELVERVPEERGWSLATVKTLLSRLVAKRAVTSEPQGRRFLYRPAIEREAIAARQADSLIDRLFGGRISPLVAQLAEQRPIDPDDLADLEALIRKLKK
jgi:predicted transcriptional regulator